MKGIKIATCIGLTSVIVMGCQKGGQKSPDDTASQGPSNFPDKKSEPAPDSGPRSNNGGAPIATVKFGVSAISAQGAFGETLSAQNTSATSGSLAIALGLTGALEDDPSEGDEGFNLVAPDPYRTPILPSTSIASGAPTDMVLRIKKIELLEKPLSGQGDDPASIGPVALTKQVLEERFGNIPADQKTALQAIVEKVFAKAPDLIGAITQITGETPEVTMNSRLSGTQDKLTEAARTISGAGPSQTVLFEDAVGRPVVLANGNVDLSQLVPGSGKFAELKAAAGQYGAVRVTYAAKGQIKGCVRMKFECKLYSNGGTNTCSTNASTANIPGLNDVNGVPPLLDYCTQSSKSPYVPGTQNSDYLGKTAEMMDFPLGSPTTGWPKNEDLTVEYALDAPVALKPDTPAKLTLAVDLNRMLRYYNRGRQDQSVNPGAPTDKSFFFTSIFADSTHVFVGDPGRIYGYEMIARVCPNGVTYNSGSGTCSSGNPNFQTSVPFWMTLITGSNGGPLKMIMMPDDDNDYTITKGSDRDAVRCAIDATTSEPEKPWVRLTSGSTVAEIHYALCDNEDTSVPRRPGPHGHLSGFPVALDEALVVPASTAISLSPATSDPNYIPGITIYTNQRQKASTTGNVHFGKVIVMRRL